jgi:predicted oxidoreductase
MGAIQKDTKEQNRQVSYDDISSSIEDNVELSYTLDDYVIDYRDVIVKLTMDLEEFIENEELTENEQKLGYALLEIFGNFDKIFQVGDGNKFNKNLILLSLREMTSLSTKEIRISIKKYRKLYDGIIGGFLE